MLFRIVSTIGTIAICVFPFVCSSLIKNVAYVVGDMPKNVYLRNEVNKYKHELVERDALIVSMQEEIKELKSQLVAITNTSLVAAAAVAAAAVAATADASIEEDTKDEPEVVEKSPLTESYQILDKPKKRGWLW